MVNLKDDSAGQNSVRYFTDWALPQLDILLPETFEPIEVWTTLDVGMQRAATASIKANTPAGAQGALVALDRDGAIRALVGGTDYVETNFNRATKALRQPGSSWKLFVYLAALEAGYKPEDSGSDTPTTIDGWTPRNSGGGYAGDMSVRTAFAYSKNTVAAQLGNEVGFGTVASMARRFGITSEISTFPSMVLGSSEVRLIDMTRAFAAVSAGRQFGRALRHREGDHGWRRDDLFPSSPPALPSWCPIMLPPELRICCRRPLPPGRAARRRSDVRLQARPARPVRTRMAIS